MAEQPETQLPPISPTPYEMAEYHIGNVSHYAEQQDMVHATLAQAYATLAAASALTALQHNVADIRRILSEWEQ